MNPVTSETKAALAGTLIFIIGVFPIFYIWIPYGIVSSRYVYAFDIGGMRYLGIGFIILGMIAAALSSIGFIIHGKGSPIPFTPTKELIVTGIYKYVRNPLYLAGSSVLIGEVLLFQSFGLLVYFIIMFGIFYIHALIEEKHLENEFGETYNHYRKSVPRWIPNLSSYKGKNGGPATSQEDTSTNY